MIRSRSKRDPPSAASIILENDAAAPTISLNARQREMKANRDRRLTDESAEGRPFMSRSNRGREPEPAQQSSLKENSRSLMGPNSRAKHSLASNRSGLRGKTNAPEDPGFLRRMLEQANQKSRRPSARAASSSRQVASMESEPQGSHAQENRRAVSTGRALNDPTERANLVLGTKKDRESLIDMDRISSLRQSADLDSDANTSKDASVNRSISAARSRDSQSAKSTTSSVRMKLDEKRKLAQQRMRPSSTSRVRGDSSASLSAASKTSTLGFGSTKSTSIASARSVSVQSTRSEKSRAVDSAKPPRAADVGTRKLIGEKMRHRRGGASRAREVEAPKEEDKGFEDFCKTLRHEALESNAHLWASFSALMQGQDTPSFVSKKSGKTYKFDHDTRNLLSVMNMHLRSMDKVVYGNETQLVNDRSMEKELAKLGDPASRQAAFAKIKQKNLSERDGGRREIMSLVTADSKSVTSDLSLSQGTTATSSTGKESASTNTFSGKGKVTASTVAKSLLSKKSNPTKDETEKSDGTSQEDSVNEIIDIHNEIINVEGVADDERSTGKEIIDVEALSAHIAKKAGKEEIINVEALEIKNEKQKVEKKASSKSHTQKEGSHDEVTWKNVKLRTVEDASRHESKSGAQPEWAALTLRKVKNDDETIEAIDLTDQVSQSAAQQNGKKNKSSNESVIHLEDTESVKSRQKVSIKEICKMQQAIAFKLRSESPGGKKQKVLLGKSSVMVVSAISDEEAADILWEISRSIVKPVAFDMSIQQVKLAGEEGSGHKVLQFSIGDDCMRFTSMLNNFKFETDSSTGEASEDADDDFASVRMEKVNDEEQSLLQKFRSLPKDAQEALQESISSEDLKDKENFLKTIGKKINDQVKRVGPPQLSVEALLKHRQEKNPPEVISAQNMPTSPVSTFSASVALSEVDQESVKKYQKMLKVGIPSESVMDKMKKDAVDERIIQVVLGDEAPASGPALSLEEEQCAARYKKMLSIGIQDDAVLQKMKKDGVDQKIVDYVLGAKADSGESKASQTPAPSLSEEEEAVADKFRKMLKIGLPKEIVEHDMKKQQVDSKIISAVLGTSVEAQPSHSAPSGGHKKKSNMTKEEEESVKEYKKLMKLQIPKEQLESRMRSEGANDKVIAAVLGRSVGGASSSDQSVSSRGSSKLVSLHWTPLSEDQLSNSVFSKALKAQTDASKLLELFQKKPQSSNQRRTKNDDNGSLSSKARLVDLNRSNNVAISLKSFQKDMDDDKLANAIRYLDPEKRLDNEKIAFLKDILPNQKEIKAVKEYYGPDDRLVPAELWFRKISAIKRIDTKVKVLRTMEMLVLECRSAEDSYNLFTRVCKQVIESDKLQGLLGEVLSIGNHMNEGTRIGRIDGFKFESLLKLVQTKSPHDNSTLLENMVQLLTRFGKRDTLELRSDFPEIKTVCRMSLNDINGEVVQIQKDLKLCQKELADLKADLSGKKAGKSKFGRPGISGGAPTPGGPPDFLSSIKKIGGGSGTSPGCGPAFLGSIKKIGSESEGNTPGGAPDFLKSINKIGEGGSVSKRAALLNKITERNQEDDSQSGENTATPSLETKEETEESKNVRSAINRLESFVQKTEPMLAHVEKLKKEAQTVAGEMSQHCGEGLKASATSGLLTTLSQFCDMLEDALTKYDARTAREARKKAKEQKAEDVSVTSDKPGQKVNGLQHVINVHSVLKSAPEGFKSDFKKGRKIFDPSDKMKQIYEAEEIIDLAIEHDDQPEIIVLDDVSESAPSVMQALKKFELVDTAESEPQTKEETEKLATTKSQENDAETSQADSSNDEQNAPTEDQESSPHSNPEEADSLESKEGVTAVSGASDSEGEKTVEPESLVQDEGDVQKSAEPKSLVQDETDAMFDLSGSTRRLSEVPKKDEIKQDFIADETDTPSKSTPLRTIPSFAKRPSPNLATSPLRSQTKPPSMPQTPVSQSKGTPVKTPAKTPVSVFSPKTPLTSSSPGKKESLSQLAMNKRRSRRSPATSSPMVQESEETTMDLKGVSKVLSPPQISHPYDEKKENAEAREPKPSSLANLSPFEKRAMAQRERRRSRQSTE